nr:MAG TPA: hypothetical protein [Caudoviricetes sp.]
MGKSRRPRPRYPARRPRRTLPAPRRRAGSTRGQRDS